MKPSLAFMAIFFTIISAARAQVVPAATGPAGLAVSGTLHYDLRFSQTARFSSGNVGDYQMSALSGEGTYANANSVRPFTMTYSGGKTWSTSSLSTESGVYQHLLASQGFSGRSWSFNFKDNVSYMPQAPTTGFSGIAGVGTLPGEPGTSTQSILTLNTRSINNQANPSFTHTLNRATSLSINGSYQITRFPDGNGLEINSLQASPQLTRRLNARNSIFGQYSISHYSYVGSTVSMGTQSAQFGYTRTWSRRLKTTASVGPEWIQGAESAGIPSSTDLTVNASASYDARSMSMMLGYTQAASGGAGVATQVGVHNHNVNAGITRQQGKNLSFGFTGSYMRTQGLQQLQQQVGVTNSKFGGVSATQRWGRYIVVSANYTTIQQSSSSALITSNSNVISGLSQVIGFSLGYSPREMRFKK
jgi:hypothetical protein